MKWCEEPFVKFKIAGILGIILLTIFAIVVISCGP